MALVLGTCLGGTAFAQGAKEPSVAAPPPAQSTQAPAERMQEPGANGMQQPSAAMQQPSAAAPIDQTATNPSPKAVKAAQRQLKAEGFYNGAIDGRIGPATQVAVREFQQRNGLKQTATLDQETLQRLMEHHG
jgi:peptidoglycan hydrolase-like protein with peptidoglycan-binding domain